MLLMLSGLMGCVVGGGESAWSFDAPGSITATVANGEVNVQSSEDATAVISWEGGGFGKNAWPDVREQGGDVVADADGGLLGGGELNILSPAGTPLILTVERGSVEVTLDQPASIDACVAAGDITLRLPEGSYDIDEHIGAGSLSEGILSEPGAEWEINVCMGAGSIDIEAYVPLEEPTQLKE